MGRMYNLLYIYLQDEIILLVKIKDRKALQEKK